MNIIAVDDKKPVLLSVESAIREASPGCTLKGFVSAKEACEYAKRTRLDVAFLDIDMAEMSGLVLAKELKEINWQTNIVFVTGYSEYAVDAFDMAASGYILKPAEPEAIARELQRLRSPVQIQGNERVRITCFGNFNIYVNGEPLVLTREKPKELLAYLVHKRGYFVRTAELAAVLWEDQEGGGAIKTNMRQVVFRTMTALKRAGIDDIILKKHDQMAIDVEKVSCDYYDFINRKASGVNAYAGEYLSEYSWAEFIIGYLDSRL